MFELRIKVSKIAEMLQVEAAMVTSGAACAMLCQGTAAIQAHRPGKDQTNSPIFPGRALKLVIKCKDTSLSFDHRRRDSQVQNSRGRRTGCWNGKGFSDNTVMALFFNAAEKSSVLSWRILAIAKDTKFLPSWMQQQMFRWKSIQISEKWVLIWLPFRWENDLWSG